MWLIPLDRVTFDVILIMQQIVLGKHICTVFLLKTPCMYHWKHKWVKFMQISPFRHGFDYFWSKLCSKWLICMKLTNIEFMLKVWFYFRMGEILYQQKYFSIDNVWNIILDIKGMVVHANSYLLFEKKEKEKTQS